MTASDELREYLASELRAATSAAIRAGADPDAVTADLQERLRRVQLMLAGLEKPTEPEPAD
jgi:Flp pilus assembly protein TadB